MYLHTDIVSCVTATVTDTENSAITAPSLRHHWATTVPSLCRPPKSRDSEAARLHAEAMSKPAHELSNESALKTKEQEAQFSKFVQLQQEGKACHTAPSMRHCTLTVRHCKPPSRYQHRHCTVTVTVLSPSLYCHRHCTITQCLCTGIDRCPKCTHIDRNLCSPPRWQPTRRAISCEGHAAN